MDNTSFIAQLREVRSNLTDAILAAADLEIKLIGPRPSDAQKSAKSDSESVGSLLSEIGALSVQLTKILNHSHEIVGEFAVAVAECAALPRHV
jgi:hypothetical protein